MKAKGTSFALAMALAWLVLAAPAQAALQCGDPVTHDTVLKKDLVCPADSSGLFIEDDGIKLDLDGHEIRGNATDADYAAVVALGVTHTVIRDGTLDGFGIGVNASGGADLLVSHLDIRHMEYYPVRLGAYNGARVEQNTVNHSGEDVVYVDGSESVTVADNVMSDGGIIFNSGSDQKAIGNSIDGTFGFGLSARPGIGLSSVEGAVVRDNLVKDAASTDIVVAGSSTGVEITDNKVRRGDANGIGVIGTPTGTLVKRNDVRAVTNHGISVDDNAGAEIRKNYVFGSLLVGIFNDEETTPVVRNTANNNGNYGINSNSGALTHDNIAKHNEPDQCIPAEGCNQ